jgi:hypothetical protein
MPFQRPPRPLSVLAGVLAAAGITLAGVGCSHITPLGPDPAPYSLPPVRDLGSVISVQVLRSQFPTPTINLLSRKQAFELHRLLVSPKRHQRLHQEHLAGAASYRRGARPRISPPGSGRRCWPSPSSQRARTAGEWPAPASRRSTARPTPSPARRSLRAR